MLPTLLRTLVRSPLLVRWNAFPTLSVHSDQLPGVIAPNHLMVLSCILNSKSRKGLLRLSFSHKTFNQLQSAGNPKASHFLLTSFERFVPFLSTQDKNLTRLDSRPLRGPVFRMCFLACTAPRCFQQLACLWQTLSSSVGRSAAAMLAVMASSWVRLHLMEVLSNCRKKQIMQ